MKAVHHDERIVSFVQISSFTISLSQLFEKHAHRAYCWPKHVCRKLSDVKT